jgi:hypothetical protein
MLLFKQRIGPTASLLQPIAILITFIKKNLIKLIQPYLNLGRYENLKKRKAKYFVTYDATYMYAHKRCKIALCP